MISERVVDSVLGYIKGCSERRVALEGWRLVLKDGLVWLENEEIGLRIRNRMKGENMSFLPHIVRPVESMKVERPPSEVVKYGFTETSITERMREMRRAGLLGTDRAGTW